MRSNRLAWSGTGRERGSSVRARVLKSSCAKTATERKSTSGGTFQTNSCHLLSALKSVHCHWAGIPWKEKASAARAASGEVGGKAGGRRRRATQPLKAKVNPRARWATSAHRANGYTVRGNARVSNQKATRLVVLRGSLLLIARPQQWRACQPFLKWRGSLLQNGRPQQADGPQIHFGERFVPPKT